MPPNSRQSPAIMPMTGPIRKPATDWPSHSRTRPARETGPGSEPDPGGAMGGAFCFLLITARLLPEVGQLLLQPEAGLQPEDLFDRAQLQVVALPSAPKHQPPPGDVDLLAAVVLAQQQGRITLHHLGA